MSLKVWIVTGAFIGGLAMPVLAAAGQDAVLAQYKAQAIAADSAFAGFSADRGKALYASSNTGGSPDTPSCSSCHTASPLKAGMTRAGKAIEPMAVSVSPTPVYRYRQDGKMVRAKLQIGSWPRMQRAGKGRLHHLSERTLRRIIMRTIFAAVLLVVTSQQALAYRVAAGH